MKGDQAISAVRPPLTIPPRIARAVTSSPPHSYGVHRIAAARSGDDVIGEPRFAPVSDLPFRRETLHPEDEPPEGPSQKGNLSPAHGHAGILSSFIAPTHVARPPRTQRTARQRQRAKQPATGLGPASGYPRPGEMFSTTALRIRALNAGSSSFSPSCRSMARRTLPSRLELKSREGSFSRAPLKNVSFTKFL